MPLICSVVCVHPLISTSKYPRPLSNLNDVKEELAPGILTTACFVKEKSITPDGCPIGTSCCLVTPVSSPAYQG
ncbi:MAG: hypothetical protein IJ880_14580 [Bacilli bacterium]|nr:hypothetical protein [Bacilli bacterium]